MQNVYEQCPVFENSDYLLRFVEPTDANDLLEVYGDKNALPFFNSDNCDGDNFYYSNLDKMSQAIDFWIKSYKTKWFVRWVIIDKKTSRAIGAVELFHRVSDDNFNGMGVLRLDVGSKYEKEDVLTNLLLLILTKAYDLFDCKEIITKVPIYAVERMCAVKKVGFKKSDYCLVGTNDHYAYNGYWTIKQI